MHAAVDFIVDDIADSAYPHMHNILPLEGTTRTYVPAGNFSSFGTYWQGHWPLCAIHHALVESGYVAVDK